MLGELILGMVSFGDKLDGKTNASLVLQIVWAKACDSSRPATINVPKGTFYVQSGRFSRPCKNNAITFRIDGTLVAFSNIQVLAKTKT